MSGVLASLFVASLTVVSYLSDSSKPAAAPPSPSASARPSPAISRAPRPTPTPAVVSGRASDLRRLVRGQAIGGRISPKSVDATGFGLVFAQNMMYTHTVTVYDSSGRLVRTISDGVTLADFGISGHPGISRGAPVEATFSPDGKYAYVSNYSMYGAGHGPEGLDSCTPSSSRSRGETRSFVYRVSTATLRIDRVVQVGLVPKFVRVTPDGRYLLVTNWCSFDMTVVDLARWRVVHTVALGSHPRGIAIAPDSRTAYVAVMGSSHLSVVNLRTWRVTDTITVGRSPRHVVIDPSGRYVYVTLNGAGTGVKVSTNSRRIVDRVSTGTQPRSAVIAPDGRSLYVVNYQSNTVSKVRTADMHVLQTAKTGVHPVGITYDPVTNDVWVAVYTGQLLVLHDR
jgi:YVTN family beta-propeller protein